MPVARKKKTYASASAIAKYNKSADLVRKRYRSDMAFLNRTYGPVVDTSLEAPVVMLQKKTYSKIRSVKKNKAKAHRKYCGALKNGKPYVHSGEVVLHFTTAQQVTWWEVIKVSKKHGVANSLNYADSAVRKRLKKIVNKYTGVSVQAFAKDPQSGETVEVELMNYL